MSGIQLREVFGFGYAVGIQREEDACFLFSQVQSFKNGIAYPFRSECADMESEGNYRFKSLLKEAEGDFVGEWLYIYFNYGAKYLKKALEIYRKGE